MRKRRSRWGLRLLLLLLTLILLVAALAGYIRPERSLDMGYAEINWKDKLVGMIDSRKPEIKISEEEFNHLAKKQVTKAIRSNELPVEITGMRFELRGDLLTVYLNGAWGPVPFGAAVQYGMEYSAGRLVLTPEAVKVRKWSLSPQLLRLERVEIDPSPYVPDPVAVQDMVFHDREMTVKFKLDWLEIAKYLSSF